MAHTKKENEINEALTGQKVTENIWLCPDGKYRWVYEFDMLRNPTILITVWKVLALSSGIVIGAIVLVTFFSGDFRHWDPGDYWPFFRSWLLLLLFMMVLGVAAYLILAGIYGWKYLVLFTMDEDGVENRAMKSQFKKAQTIGWLTAAAGALSGNIGQVGTGILAATRDCSISEFVKVRKVKTSHWKHVIYVNQALEHNQIYAEDPDFDFVRDYIINHCVNAKKVS